MDDNQLVSAYLMEKVAGRPLPPDCPVLEWDLYGDMEPWEIWERFRGSNPNPNEEEDLYFFTRLKKLNHPSGDIFINSISKSYGFWSQDNLERVIVVDGVRCGVRMRRYRNERVPENQKRWLLKEYCLCDFRDSYVLCLLKKLKKSKTVSESGLVKLEKRLLEIEGWRAGKGVSLDPEIWSKRWSKGGSG